MSGFSSLMPIKLKKKPGKLEKIAGVAITCDPESAY
jgi:hypothetical protein